MKKLLLRADVKALGRIGDIVDVKDGFARNFLIPQGLAVEPTPANIARVEEARKIVEARRAQELAEKRAVAERLSEKEIMIVATANEQGVLFGSVGPKEISDALHKEGYNVDPKHVMLSEHIKNVDRHSVTIELAPEVTSVITVWVTSSTETTESSDQGDLHHDQENETDSENE